MNIKTKLLAILLLLCSSWIDGKALPKSFTIHAKIQGLADGTKIKLVPAATHADEVPASEAIVSSGAFTLMGVIDGPRLFSLQVADGFGAYSLMMEEGVVDLTGDVSASTRGTDKVYSFKNMVLKGNKLQDLYLQKKSPRGKLDSLYEANAIANKDVSMKLNAAFNKKDSIEINAIKKSDAYTKLAADDKAFFATVESTFAKMISDNKDSWWGPLIMLDLYSYFTDDQKPVYAQFSAEAKNSYYGKVLNDVLNPKGFKGQAAPLLDMRANNNNAFDIASLTRGHKYVLLDFWASWCAPCRKSIPALKKTYENLKDKGFQIVSISIDKKEADWQKAELEEKLPWPSFLDNGKTANAWKIRAIPATFLLNEKGVVVGENLTLEEIAALMK